jgi:hypothetical protein
VRRPEVIPGGCDCHAFHDLAPQRASMSPLR